MYNNTEALVHQKQVFIKMENKLEIIKVLNTYIYINKITVLSVDAFSAINFSISPCRALVDLKQMLIKFGTSLTLTLFCFQQEKRRSHFGEKFLFVGIQSRNKSGRNFKLPSTNSKQTGGHSETDSNSLGRKFVWITERLLDIFSLMRKVCQMPP